MSVFEGDQMMNSVCYMKERAKMKFRSAITMVGLMSLMVLSLGHARDIEGANTDRLRGSGGENAYRGQIVLSSGSVIGGGGLNDVQVHQGLVGNAVDAIDLGLLNQAKNDSQDLDLLHAIMEVEAQWQEISNQRNRRSSIRKMISSALSSAAEGRFEAAEFIMNDVTASVLKRDEAVVAHGLAERYEAERDALARLMARETVRSGRQAGRAFDVLITRQTKTVNDDAGGFLFWKSDKNEVITENEQVNKHVWLPEVMGSEYLYDQENERRFDHPVKKELTLAEFKNEALSLTQPYLKETKGDYGLHDYLTPNLPHIPSAFICGVIDVFATLGGDHLDCGKYFMNHEPVKIVFAEWLDSNSRYLLPGSEVITYRGFEYRELLEADRKVWGGALFARLSELKSVLQQMWDQAGRGYNFRVSSEQYQLFRARLKHLKAAVEQVAGNQVTQFLTQDQVDRLALDYPELAGDRPRNIEVAVVQAVSLAQAANEDAVAKLLRRAVTYGHDPVDEMPVDTENVALLASADATAIQQHVRESARSSSASQELRDHLVELYMLGHEDTVRDIFAKLTQHIRAKFLAMNVEMDEARQAVLDVKNQLRGAEYQEQMDLIAEAEVVVHDAVNRALEPNLFVTKETAKTPLRDLMSEKKIKKIYKELDELRYVQQGVRVALQNAKSLARKAFDLYKHHPSDQVREALVGLHAFHSNKVADLAAGYWPYRKYGEAEPVFQEKNGERKPVFEFDDNGKAIRQIFTQPVSIAENPLFTEAQLARADMKEIMTVTQVESVYADTYFGRVTEATKLYAQAITRVYRQFEEYPSKTMAVSLKKNFENFYQLRDKSRGEFDNHRIAAEVEEVAVVDRLRQAYKGEIAGIHWLDAASGEAVNEAERITQVEAARARFDDLLQ